ncbi:carboxypeptidase regulatory-like domain-containing protein [Acidobacteria bacterium AH-259-D05]|nr:carboxypeptidase regulatory-like domain-containing protein [Acidobacteria bacterium AH-259-D05]
MLGTTILQPKVLQKIGPCGVVIAVLLASSMLWAQVTSSTISGTVTDEQGASLGSVKVTVRHLETGRTWSLLTGEQGIYVAPSLPLGSYVVEASSDGFKTAVIGIHLKTAREVMLDLTLKAAESTEKVKREEAPVVLQGLQRRRRTGRPTSVVTRGNVDIFPEAHRAPQPPEPPPVEPPRTRQLVFTSTQTIGFAVQMAAYRERPKAEEFRAMLQNRGYSAYVIEADIPGSGRFYRVRVGPFSTLEQAKEVTADMRSRLAEPLPDFWIVPHQQ